MGITWFRHDLRVRDHPALRAALERHDEVVPAFFLDDRLLYGCHESGNRTRFMLECLAELSAELGERGGGLYVRCEAPERGLVELAGEVGAEAIHFTRDVSPYAREWGQRVTAALEGSGVELCGWPGLNVVNDVAALRTKSGDRPYTVFSPFHRAWEQLARRDVLEAPRKVTLPHGLDLGQMPTLAQLGLAAEAEQAAPGGESPAHATLERFLGDPVRRYGDTHDALGEDRTSRLSPYLHFGAISARYVEDHLPAGKGPEAFRRQLAWRDFYHHVIHHFPANAHVEHQERYRGTRYYEHDDEAFAAWCEGRTGYPLVDAGMRQLLQEGWMHNRARLVVGSFLTKDLGIDWRRGERWFMRHLIDGDEANNNGNWQWIASVGTDPQPYFRRIYNPALQMQRHDPKGAYVRRHVPELRAVPDEHLRQPWTMPDDVQRAVGCVIGEHYPAPIVDHADARRRALERYRSALAG